MGVIWKKERWRGVHVMNLNTIVATVAAAATAGVAGAQVDRISPNPVPDSPFNASANTNVIPGTGQTGTLRGVGGDTFGAGVTVFNAGGDGAILFDGSATDPLTFATDPDPMMLAFAGSMGMNLVTGQEGSVFTNATSNAPGTLDISVQWAEFDANGALASMVPAGTTLNGTPVTDIQFEIGGPSVLMDTIESVMPGTFFDGVISNNFALFDSTGAVLFSDTIAGAGDISTGGLQAAVGINAGGADLGDFDIAGGQFDFTLSVVPAPGGAAALSMLGFAAMRRRR